MLTYWESEDIFLDGDHYFDCLVNDIHMSRDYISIEMYMFNDDLLGKKIATALATAQERGVKIQIMVDGVGSYQFFKNLDRFFREKNIYVKIFNPLPFLHPYFGKIGFLRRIELWGTRMLRLNKRNHRKIITIDHSIMYTGSYNFSVEHTLLSKERPWKDMGVRVSGPNVKFSVLNFKRIWKLRDHFRYLKRFPELKKLHWKNSPQRLNQNLIRKRFFNKDLFDRIKKAKNHIWLTTPYFIPNRKLIRALSLAAIRGVDVRILTSQRTDILMFRTLQFFYYPYLLKKGVKVFQYQETVLHAKNFIIDEWVTVGTSNLNHRSLLHDLEVDLVIQDKKNRSTIIEDFKLSAQDQIKITQESLSNRTIMDKVLSRIFFLFKYWF